MSNEHGRRLTVVAALSLSLAACSDDPTLEVPDREVCLVRSDGARYCIDVYEASRRDATASSAGEDLDSPPQSVEGRRPWVDITWAAAEDACARKGKRLCERDEWIDACDGVPGDGGSTYGYEGMLDAARCNTSGGGPEASGSRPACLASTGTYDQSGNVWEWTGGALSTAAARGGGFRSSLVHRCTSGDGVVAFEPASPSTEVGFRCCR